MNRLSDWMGSAIGRREALRAARAMRILRRWPEFVGEFLASKSWPDRFDRGVVYVAVEGSAWSQELRMLKERIVKRLEEAGGEPGLFEDLRFGVRTLPEREVEVDLAKADRHRKAIAGLTIREIAERRLGTWEDEG